MIAVVIDSNIIRDSPHLTRSEWISLSENAADWGVELLVPEVVLMETTRVVPREWINQRDALMKVKVRTFGLQDDLDAMVDTINAHIEGYEEQLKARMAELGVKVAPMPDVPHMEIAYRASRRTAPYHESDKDGYRDTLIWFTVLDVASSKPDHEVWFVSNNAADFGDPEVKRAPDDAAGPIPRPFHPQLRQDLKERGLDGRVIYATSLRALEHHIAALSGPISGDALSDLVEQLQWDVLQDKLNDETSILVPAKDLALSPRFDYGVIQIFLDASGPWRFSDAAGRVHGRWTANFSVDLTTEILALTDESDGASSVIVKPLRVSGTATFTNEGEPLDIQISGLVALPDDPDRALWNILAAAETVRRVAAGLGLPEGVRQAAQQAAANLKLSKEAAENVRQATEALELPEGVRQAAQQAAANLKLSNEAAENPRMASSVDQGQASKGQEPASQEAPDERQEGPGV